MAVRIYYPADANLPTQLEIAPANEKCAAEQTP